MINLSFASTNSILNTLYDKIKENKVAEYIIPICDDLKNFISENFMLENHYFNTNVKNNDKIKNDKLQKLNIPIDESDIKELLITLNIRLTFFCNRICQDSNLIKKVELIKESIVSALIKYRTCSTNLDLELDTKTKSSNSNYKPRYNMDNRDNRNYRPRYNDDNRYNMDNRDNRNYKPRYNDDNRDNRNYRPRYNDNNRDNINYRSRHNNDKQVQKSKQVYKLEQEPQYESCPDKSDDNFPVLGNPSTVKNTNTKWGPQIIQDEIDNIWNNS
jgi:hypothetical protein